MEGVDLGLLVESVPDAVMIVSGEGKVILINAEAGTMFGYSRQELVGQSIRLLVPERLHGIHTKLRGSYLSKPCLRPMGTTPGIIGQRRDGSEFPIEISLSPSGEAGRFVAIIHDVTKRRQVEQDC